MDKIEKLISGAAENALSAYRAYGKTVEPISARMDYIVRHCVEAVGGKVYFWDWLNGDDAESSADGEFAKSFDEVANTVAVNWRLEPASTMRKLGFLVKGGDGIEWDLSDGVFPARWLYEDFEEEFAEGRKAFVEQQKAKAEREKSAKVKREAAKKAAFEAATAKLTDDEKKALGLKWKKS